MKNVFEILGIDKKVNYVGQKIPKKMFYQHGNLSKDDEKIFLDYIDKIEMSYVLDSNNINIDPLINEEYNYPSIGYMKVMLKKDDKLEKISKIMQSNIPSPLIIVFEYNGNVCISCSLKRVNKSDNSKVVVDDINTTPWIDFDNIDENSDRFISSMSMSNLDHSNFYNFYKMIDDKIYTFKNLEVVGEYKQDDSQSIEYIKGIIEKINAYEGELNKIIIKIKKESQFNKKMKFNIEANNIKDKMKILKQKLNNKL
ncbi:DUF4391 domain-containing protein [Terrisporobacter glycolicus]|uniref:DUF4391 domain-containing protein n=1 Tax=Terrisporobacter glycolicus TaxID=36841 RepID=UPI003463CF6B